MSRTLGWMEDRTFVSLAPRSNATQQIADCHHSEVEFWCGQPSRLHDRYKYTRDKAQEGGEWKIERLAP